MPDTALDIEDNILVNKANKNLHITHFLTGNVSYIKLYEQNVYYVR